MRHRSDSATVNMLPQRCPKCAEEGAPGIRSHNRLQRTSRLIFVTLVLLLGVTMATLVLLLFGSPALLRRDEPSVMPNGPSALEHTMGKLQSDNHLAHPSVRLTIKEESHPEWQYAKGNAHSRGEMTFEGGNLTVPRKGLYRLYLQITFEFTRAKYNNNRDMCANDLLDLMIKVERFSVGYKEFRDLLVSEETMSCKDEWTKSMYTSGTFELETFSQIKVNLTHEDLIIRSEARSFFGAELISDH